MYALIDRSDAWHTRVRSWWERHGDDVRVPITVLPELSHLIMHRLGAHVELAFIDSVAADEFVIESPMPEDFSRIAALMKKYADVPIGFVDASVATLAEQLDTLDIATTDRRHFSVIRPRHGRSFRLHP